MQTKHVHPLTNSPLYLHPISFKMVKVLHVLGQEKLIVMMRFLCWVQARQVLCGVFWHLAYSGDEEPEDLDIQMAVLKTAMVARLAKNCSSNDLTFTPEQLTGFIISLNSHRNDLLKMAQEADVTGSIQQQLVNALPLSLSKKTRKKAQVSEILVELFFVVNEIMNSPSIEMPGRHSPFYKTLEAFITSLVRVRNYCNHELNNKEVKKRALKSMPITGELKSYLFDCVSYFVCPLNNNIPCPR